MPKQEEFVVMRDDLGPVLYLTGYNAFDPPSSIFGNLENAIIFETLDEAETVARSIGPGPAGVPKP